MKAWLVRKEGECYATVVFAETRGKARSMAMATDACEDADFCDIEVHRLPHIDKYYKEGKKELDWYDDKDRHILVKECDFRCENVGIDLCEDCTEKYYCAAYEECIEAWEDESGYYENE